MPTIYLIKSNRRGEALWKQYGFNFIIGNFDQFLALLTLKYGNKKKHKSVVNIFIPNR